MHTVRFCDVLKLNAYWRLSNWLFCIVLVVLLPVVFGVVGILVGLLIAVIKTVIGG